MEELCLIGGSGFIGVNLALDLKHKYKIKVIGRSINSFFSNIDNVEYVVCDTVNTDLLIETCRNSDFVVWLASSLLPTTKSENLVIDYNSNNAPLILFLEKSFKLPKLSKFIFISSGGTVYGDSINRVLLNENDSASPKSSYGLSKYISEKYIEFLTHSMHFQSVILRPSNVYGPYQNLEKPQGIIGYAFKSLLNHSSIDLYNEGMVTRDFVYVSDLNQAICCCLAKRTMISKVSIFNVGSGEGLSIKCLLEKIEFISKRKLNCILKPAREFDCDFNVLDISKIQLELEWKPTYKIEDGLFKVWNWIKNEK